MKKLLIILSGLFFVTLTACEQVITIDLPDYESKIVIEGSITDQPGPYTVRITRSVPYFSGDTVPRVTGAVVTISDDAGNLDSLIEVSPGIYQTTSIQGAIGRTYTMRAVVDGQLITAMDKMNRVNPIDSLTSDSISNFVFLESGYYVTAYAQEPPGPGDFFRFRFYENDSLYDGIGDLFFSNDQTVDGNYAEIFLPYHLHEGDTVKFEILSLSNTVYDYYLTMQQLLTSAGNPFGAPSDNIVTNIIGPATGIFQANAIASATLVVQP